MIIAKVVTSGQNLQQLVAQINNALWDEANDMSVYDVDSLALYLNRPDTVFVSCHEVQAEQVKLLGIASARIEIKPYARETWLYIDELDVCVNQRQKGAGTQMMTQLLQVAKEYGCDEVWLGTEMDNTAANALYQSLQPSEKEAFVGYAYKIKK